MNFLYKPRNLDYVVTIYSKDGSVLKQLSGSDALTALSSIEKSVNVNFITTVSSGDISLVSDSVYPDTAFNTFKLSVVRRRSFTLAGYLPEPESKDLFFGEITLPYAKKDNNSITFPVKSYLISKNLDQDINLGSNSAANHVVSLLGYFEDVSVDTASFTALGDLTSFSLFLERDWFSTFNEVITALCWVGKFAIYFEGKTAKAINLFGIPAELTTVAPEDVLLENFLIKTKGETEVITRLNLTDQFNNKVNWYNNVDIFGDNQESFKLPYAGLFTADVTNAANFWLNRKSNLWVMFDMKLPIKYAGLEPYSVVELTQLSRWFTKLNLQPIDRYYFNSELPTYFTFTNSIRTLFKNGGFVWFKGYIPSTFAPGEDWQILNLGNGSGIWYYIGDGTLYLDMLFDETDPANRYTYATDLVVPLDEIFDFEMSWNEETPAVSPVIKINGVAATVTAFLGVGTSLYEVGSGSYVAKSQRGADNYAFAEGFFYDFLFYNQSEGISFFASMARERHGELFGLKELVPVPGGEETGVDEAWGQVQKVTINMDATIDVTVETDIEAVSGNRNLTYWTGPGNDSGIKIIGQVVDDLTALATLTWQPLVNNFTKYELVVEKNGSPFYSNDNIVDNSAIVNYVVLLTAAESNTYTWKVRGFME